MEMTEKSTERLDEFECACFDITDDFLSNAKIAAYLYNQRLNTPEGELKPYSQKSFPEKAIDIMVPVSDGTAVEIFLRTNECGWGSRFVADGVPGTLGPRQMAQFFSTGFYSRMLESLTNRWPVSDPTFGRLFGACLAKRMLVPAEFGWEAPIDEADRVDQPNKRVDLANRDVTGDGKRDYTSTGRKIVDFSDQGVKGNSAECYCWPNPKYPFKWSQWKDWTKIKPLCKMSFEHGGRKYGISLAPFVEDSDNRGFRGYDIAWQPPLAWLTPDECAQVMKLSIVRKFIRQVMKDMKPYLDMSAEEIYEKINNKDKITMDEIRTTKRVIKHVYDTALRKQQADTYRFD